MKKNVILSSFVAVFAVSSLVAEARLEQGTQELGVQGNLDLDAQDDYELNLDLTYGRFVRDNWQIGAKSGVGATGSVLNFDLGLFTEYNFNNQSNWVPYVGASAGLASANFDFDEEIKDTADVDLEDVTALNVALAGGIKYFVNDNVAIAGEINYNVATDDINFDGDELSDSATKVLIGTRFYF